MRRATLPLLLLVLIPLAPAAEVNVTVAAASNVTVAAERVEERMWRVRVENRGSIDMTARPYLDIARPTGPLRVVGEQHTVSPGEMFRAPVVTPYPGAVEAAGFGSATVAVDEDVPRVPDGPAHITVIRPYPDRVRIEARFPRPPGHAFVSVNRTPGAATQYHVEQPGHRIAIDHRLQPAITGETTISVAVRTVNSSGTAVRTVSRSPVRGIAATAWSVVEAAWAALHTYVFFI